MAPKKRMKWVSFLLLWLSLVPGSLGCSSSSSKAPEAKGSWYYESDFFADPDLAATPQDVVILDIPPRAESEPPQTFGHEIPYAYTSRQEYVFCIDTDDGILTGMELMDDHGSVVLELDRNNPCGYVALAPGRYTKRIFHDSTQVHSTRSSVAFMHPKGNPTQSQAIQTFQTPQNSSPPIPIHPAYGALVLQEGPYAGDYLATTRTPSELAGMTFNTLKAASLETDKDLFSDMKHLYSFKSVSNARGAIPLAQDATASFFGHFDFLSWKNPPFAYWVAYCETDPELCLANQAHPFNSNTVVFPVFESYEGAESITAYLEARGEDPFALWTSAAYVFIHPHTSIYPETNGIFYYTDYARDGSPPAVFKTDPRFRFYEDGRDVPELTDGEAAVFEDSNYTGRAWVLNSSFKDMTLLPITRFASIKVKGDFTNLMLYKNKDFDQWVMTVGFNMAQLDPPIAGGDIGSFRLFNAKKYFISTRECEHCYLANADFSGKQLDRVDLSYADLLQVNFQKARLKKSILTDATLGGAILDEANLDGANLSGALLNGQINPFGIHVAAASAAGVFLRNANLQYADLSGVNFSNANIYGTSVSGPCNPGEDGFTSGCACASHTTMNVSTFSNAYMANLDMSNAVITGGDFSDAILCGADLNGATLQLDNKTGQRVLLTGAFLQGADFANAKISGVNFKNAYVDLKGNLCLLFQLAPAHLGFPGYWRVPADGECAGMAISPPTNIEGLSTGNQDTCPDGSPGPCSSDDRWQNPGSYVSPQIFGGCFDNTPICAIDWDWMDSGN